MIDEEFLAQLPLNVEPCGGENGKFHTFVFNGPIFNNPVKFSFSEIVCRDSFYTAILFGGLALLERGFSMFRESRTTTPFLWAA